jgi:NAD(P)-dependent dehydrogenase (short-subunit alcohol dehydrogenase family)
MDRLQSKRALVTGHNSGIGLETARRLQRGRAQVTTTGTNPCRELDKDVVTRSALADSLRQTFGQLGILCVNAGIIDMRPVGQRDEATYDRSYAIDLKGPGDPSRPVFAPRTLSSQLISRGIATIAESLKGRIPTRRVGTAAEIASDESHSGWVANS